METLSTAIEIVNRNRPTHKPFDTRVEAKKLQRRFAKLNRQQRLLSDEIKILAAIAQSENAEAEATPEHLVCPKCRCSYSSSVKSVGSRCNTYTFFDSQKQKFVRTAEGCSGTLVSEPFFI